MHWPQGEEKSLEEITSASGGSCGSSFIDSNMRALLMEKLKLPADVASSCAVETMMDTFTEKIKVTSNMQWNLSHVNKCQIMYSHILVAMKTNSSLYRLAYYRIVKGPRAR